MHPHSSAWNRQACRDHQIDFCHLLPGIHLEELWDLHSTVGATSRMHLSVYIRCNNPVQFVVRGTWKIWGKSFPYCSLYRRLLNGLLILALAQDENRPQLLPWDGSRWFVCCSVVVNPFLFTRLVLGDSSFMLMFLFMLIFFFYRFVFAFVSLFIFIYMA